MNHIEIKYSHRTESVFPYSIECRMYTTQLIHRTNFTLVSCAFLCIRLNDHRLYTGTQHTQSSLNCWNVNIKFLFGVIFASIRNNQNCARPNNFYLVSKKSVSILKWKENPTKISYQKCTSNHIHFAQKEYWSLPFDVISFHKCAHSVDR